METDPLKINQTEAETAVDSLEGITSSEIERLKAINIEILADLWSRTWAKTFQLTGFDEIAAKSKISSRRLVELLPSSLLSILGTELLRQADELGLKRPADGDSLRQTLRRTPVGRWHLVAAQRFGPWFRRHMLDWILLLSLLSLGFLTLRAAGVFSNYPAPLGLSESVVVTSRDLKAGDALQLSRDVATVRLPLKWNYFTSTIALDGLIMREDVSAQKPLRAENLLQLQLVATRDIPGGEKIVKDAVALAWSPYQAKALVSPASAVDHQTRVALRKDGIITADMVVP
jgi:hypothetical protein